MRYARQEIYENIGKKGQKTLKEKTIAIIGVGALGSHTASMLARAGVGTLILYDRDVVDLTNLQRQILFTEKDIGKPKAVAAKQHLSMINSDIKIIAHPKDINHETIQTVKADIILDGTDNMETRFLINEYCVKNKLTWIYAAVLKDMGYVLNFVPGKACFRCVFKEASKLETCATAGIMNTVVATIAGIQVTEALKILLGREPTKGLIRFNIWKLELDKIKVQKQTACQVCGKETYEFLQGLKSKDTTKFCGSGTYQITGEPVNLFELEDKLKKVDKVVNKYNCLHFQDMTIFRDGRVLIKADSEEEAKSLYSMYIGN